MYKNIFGVVLVGGALIFGFLLLKQGKSQEECAYTIFRFSPKQLIPLVEERMSFGSVQVRLLNELDEILDEGAVHINQSRHEMMDISAKDIISGKLDTQLLYSKTVEDDKFLQERTLKALKKMEEFIASLNPKQRLLVSNKLTEFRTECSI
ncbi:MAG: hypothetical protein ABUK01_04555 [Leptospirales bacterium]